MPTLPRVDWTGEAANQNPRADSYNCENDEKDAEPNATMMLPEIS